MLVVKYCTKMILSYLMIFLVRLAICYFVKFLIPNNILSASSDILRNLAVAARAPRPDHLAWSARPQSVSGSGPEHCANSWAPLTAGGCFPSRASVLLQCEQHVLVIVDQMPPIVNPHIDR